MRTVGLVMVGRHRHGVVQGLLHTVVRFGALGCHGFVFAFWGERVVHPLSMPKTQGIPCKKPEKPYPQPATHPSHTANPSSHNRVMAPGPILASGPSALINWGQGYLVSLSSVAAPVGRGRAMGAFFGPFAPTDGRLCVRIFAHVSAMLCPEPQTAAEPPNSKASNVRPDPLSCCLFPPCHPRHGCRACAAHPGSRCAPLRRTPS